MADLLSSLSSASQALDAQRYGMDVVGQNIANVNTPGYARRTIDISEVPPPDANSAGGGATVTSVRALRDRMLDLRLRQEVPAQTSQSAQSDALSVVEAALGQPGQSIDAKLASFFDSFSKLADNPTSAVARQEVLMQGTSLATSFQDMSNRFTTAQRDADQQVRSLSDQINTLAGQIAGLNGSIGAAAATGGVPAIQDQQLQLVRQLSALADVQVIEQSNGTMDVSIGSGKPLVVSNNTYKLTASSVGPTGMASILSSDGTDITSKIKGGKLGGYLQVRDADIPSYMSQLDSLAYGVVQQVNTLHSTGFDQTGAAAGNFFTPLGASAGAAAAIAVDPAITANVSKIAAASVADPGDNQMARNLAGLGTATVLSGGTATFTDAWGQLVYTVGRDSKAAQDGSTSHAAIVSQVDALRDQVSGVSLDEEATNLLKFQRAYEANAKFFQAADQAISTLMAAFTPTA